VSKAFSVGAGVSALRSPLRYLSDEHQASTLSLGCLPGAGDGGQKMNKTDVILRKSFCEVTVTAEDLQEDSSALSYYLRDGWEITYDGRPEEDDDGA
jgi:hypothetical protein